MAGSGLVAVTPTPTPISTPTPTAAGTRDPSQIPFASTSIFNLPIGSDAQWTPNAQLAGADIYVNTTLSEWNENIWTGTASDPLVTVTDTGSVDGTPGTFQVHIPVGAEPAAGSDATFSVDDTATQTWYSFGNFAWTSATTATVTQGSAESDYGSGIQDANSDWDEGVGTLRESDLQAGTINHMLRIQLPPDMLESYSTSVDQLAPNAWPQTQEDGFAVNGDGGEAYSGTVPYGVTIGIPATAVEPADVAANAGANMLWHALQDHGAMIRDSGGSGNTITMQADQDVSGSDPLILGMEQYSSEIMAQAEILANQGPNSVNGGGTPIVPLDPAPSDAPGSATATSITIASGTASTTVSQSQVSITATSGNHMLFLSGSGDTVSLSGGTDTITDSGSGNTYVLPAAGNGSDAFNSNIFNLGDTLDLTTALAATNWNGSASTLANYLTVADSASAATVSISATSGGPGTAIATITGANTATLSSLLTHAIT